MNNLNLIIDSKTSYKSLKRIHSLEPSHISVLDLDNNIEYINRLKYLMGEKCIIDVVDINLKKIASSKILQKKYVSFISNLSKINIIKGKENTDLKNFLLIDDISYWWLTTIAEKNPLKRNTFYKVNILYNLIYRIKENNFKNVYIDIKDKEISSTLAKNLANSHVIHKYNRAFPELIYFLYALLNASKLFIKLFIRSILCKLIAPSINNSKINFKFISTYRDSLDSNIQNPYFQTLISEMERNDISYKNIYMLDGFNFKKNTSDLLSLKKKSYKKDYDLIDRYIKLQDIYKIIKRYLLLIQKLIHVKKAFKNNLIFLEIDFYKLLLGDLYISFAGQAAIDNLYKDILFKEYFRINLNDKKILYPLEMQAWEKIMNNHKNEYSKNISSYGIQHVPISFLMLNYFYNHSDFNEESIIGMPLPDKALLFSENDYKFFKNMGWPEKKIRNFGSIRFQKYKNISQTSWKSKKNIVAIVLPGDKNQCTEIIEYLYHSILNLTYIDFHITHHPQIKDFSISAVSRLTNLKNCFNSKHSTDHLAHESKVMITYGSSAVIPGILNLCFVIIPILPSSLPLDPAFNKLNAVSYLHSKYLIKEAIKEIFLSDRIPDESRQIFHEREHFLTLRNKDLYLKDLNYDF